MVPGWVCWWGASVASNRPLLQATTTTIARMTVCSPTKGLWPALSTWGSPGSYRSTLNQGELGMRGAGPEGGGPLCIPDLSEPGMDLPCPHLVLGLLTCLFGEPSWEVRPEG